MIMINQQIILNRVMHKLLVLSLLGCVTIGVNGVSAKDELYQKQKAARKVQPGRYDHVAHGGLPGRYDHVAHGGLPGRYDHVAHGGLRGKYVHDNRGTYIHIHIPYDGGYGDRGLPYIHDYQGHILKRPVNSRSLFPLSADDHVHFSLDFNLNGTGWQIIKFYWTRDGDPDYNYNFESANRLWEVIDENDEEYVKYEMGSGEPDSENTDYAENGGYQYGVKGSNKSNDSYGPANNLQKALIDILEYLARNIIPNV